MGFGYTQLLPIIIKIALIVENSSYFFPGIDERPESILLLEEPESNLHPCYQSKLAEMIVEAVEKFNIQFIIETHSEYFIRKLQYLTAINKLKSRDTNIYYFHQPDTEDFKNSPFRKIEILPDGRLSQEFGEGFFDEIPKLLAFLYDSSFN
jgi:predicted ATPase